MGKSKRERYEQNRTAIQDRVDSGKITQSDREYIFEFLDAKDPECGLVTDPNDKGKSDGTLATYAYSLRRLAEMGDFELVSATPDELNRFLDDMRNGRINGVKDEGLSKGTVSNYQKALRKFYEYHSELGISKEKIILYTREQSSVDERDIFDSDDIEALRKAAEHPRNKALIDMLLYTGQRRSALLNLRIKDIDVDEGVFYLNEEAGDLKGANGKRPLLYAEKSVREWLRVHPCRDDPEAHFFTQRSPNIGQHDYEQGTRLDGTTIHYALKRIGEKAGIDKPVNAHNFRHTFVTICKRNYGMDNDTIKRLIGHRMDSTVMETTYAHLTDDDIIAEAERQTGLREDESDSPLTPDVCDVCDEPISVDNAKACPSCGTVFTPDAADAQKKIQQDIGAARALSDGEISDEELEAIANDDALLAKLIEMRSGSGG